VSLDPYQAANEYSHIEASLEETTTLARIEGHKFRGVEHSFLASHHDAHQLGVAQLLHVRHSLVQFGGQDTPRTLVTVGFA
jgi:hypothetical protein